MLQIPAREGMRNFAIFYEKLEYLIFLGIYLTNNIVPFLLIVPQIPTPEI